MYSHVVRLSLERHRLHKTSPAVTIQAQTSKAIQLFQLLLLLRVLKKAYTCMSVSRLRQFRADFATMMNTCGCEF